MNWEDGVRKVVPYVPGEQPKCQNIIKLNTNECPYPPAPGVEGKLAHLNYGNLRLYPDSEAVNLTQSLADFYGVDTNQVFVGVGSDDVLSMAFLTFFNSGKEILFPDITYSFYDVWADLYRIPYKRVPLDENFCIHTEDYLVPNGGIVIANPNAPTGVFKPVSEIEKIIKGNPDRVVIVDEAYIDFGGESVLPILDQYENLLIVQTFSKSRAMAGMRVGFAIGNPKLIGYLADAKYSFNSYTMNMPTLELAVEAVTDAGYFYATNARVVQTREWVKKELMKIGFSFPDSKTNFVFMTHESVPAEEIFHKLREENIVVRHFDKPRINNYLRMSMGTDEQMKHVIEVLTKIVGK